MKKRTAIIFIAVAVCLALVIGAIKRIGYADGDRYAAGNARISDEVKAIDINWVSGKVSVAAYDGDEILLTEEADRQLPEEKQMHWLLDGDTLRVQYTGPRAFRMNNAHKELTVLLPEDLLLDEVNINVVSAGLDVEDINAEVLHINTVSGQVRAECSRVEEAKANSVSGGVHLLFERAPGKITADSVSGSLKISLPGDAGFEAEMDSVSGRVNSSFDLERKDDDTYVYGNGRCRIDANTVSGKLTLDELR